MPICRTAFLAIRAILSALSVSVSWGATYRWVGHASPHGIWRAVGRRISAREAGTRGADRRVQWRLPVHHLLRRIHDDSVHYKDNSLERWIQPWTTSTPPWRTVRSNNIMLVTNRTQHRWLMSSLLLQSVVMHCDISLQWKRYFGVQSDRAVAR